MVEERHELPPPQADYSVVLLPQAWQKSIFKGGRFYFMGENVLTWSKFKLWDPELNTSNGISYPNVRTFSIGVNFNL